MVSIKFIVVQIRNMFDILYVLSSSYLTVILIRKFHWLFKFVGYLLQSDLGDLFDVYVVLKAVRHMSYFIFRKAEISIVKPNV